MIYLDHAATSPLLPTAREAMLEAMDIYGNTSSLHSAGQAAKNIIEDARAKVARLINADPSEIIFTSGATEANNTVLHTFADQPIWASPFEHPSVANSTKSPSSDRSGPLGQVLCPSEGLFVHPATEHTVLYCQMLANNEIGAIFDVKKLTEKAHEASAYVSSDITQALGKIPVDVKALDVDYATFSAHKIGGPVGIGALYIKAGSPLKPLLTGGHQEHGRRAGTSPTVNIAGFGAAADYALKNRTWELYENRIRPLKDELARRIIAEIPGSRLNVLDGPTLPNILNVSFAAAEGESIQLYLDAAGIEVSTGSACASGDGQPSPVLMTLTHDAEIAHSSIRFSFGLDNTSADVTAVMSVLPDIIKKLQSFSTIGVTL